MTAPMENSLFSCPSAEQSGRQKVEPTLKLEQRSPAVFEISSSTQEIHSPLPSSTWAPNTNPEDAKSALSTTVEVELPEPIRKAGAQFLE